MPEKPVPPTSNNPQVIIQDSSWKTKKILYFITFTSIILIITLSLLSLTGKISLPFFPEQNRTIAIIGNQKIDLNKIKNLANEKYSKKANTKELRQAVLDMLIERAILDQEAKRLQISVSEEEFSNYINIKNKAFKQPIASASSLLTDLKYDLLKEKILAKSVESRQAFTISYWTPPLSWKNLPNIKESTLQEQREQGESMLKEAEQRLKKEEKALNAALELAKKYPAMKDLIAVNGYSLGKTTDQTVLNKPVLYVFDQKNTGQLFYDTLFALKQNEIKLVIKDDGSGGWVFQVVNINQGNKLSYDEWLKNKKQELVKTYSPL